MSDHSQESLDARDASSAVIIGAFFVLMSLPVIAGVFYATETIDRTINFVAGLIIFLVGVGFILRGRAIHRKSHTGWTDR